MSVDRALSKSSAQATAVMIGYESDGPDQLLRRSAGRKRAGRGYNPLPRIPALRDVAPLAESGAAVLVPHLHLIVGIQQGLLSAVRHDLREDKFLEAVEQPVDLPPVTPHISPPSATDWRLYELRIRVAAAEFRRATETDLKVLAALHSRICRSSHAARGLSTLPVEGEAFAADSRQVGATRR
jgi:hypothetical protein